MTFIGLATVGFVNVLSYFQPYMGSKEKLAATFAFAFILTFIPNEIGIMVFDKAKIAIEVAFASSGAYKIATKAGGK